MIFLLLLLQSFFSMDVSDKLPSSSEKYMLSAYSSTEVLLWAKNADAAYIVNTRTKRVRQFSLNSESDFGIAALAAALDRSIFVTHPFAEEISEYTAEGELAAQHRIENLPSSVTSLAVTPNQHLFILDADAAKLVVYNTARRKTARVIERNSSFKLKLQSPSRLIAAPNRVLVIDGSSVHHFSVNGDFLFTETAKAALWRRQKQGSDLLSLSPAGEFFINDAKHTSGVLDFVILGKAVFIFRESSVLERIR